MRITINLPEGLLAQAKEAAREAGSTLTEFVSDAVRAALPRKKTRSELGPMPAFKPMPGQEGLQPGVDLNNTAALLDLMDKDDSADKG